MRISADSAATLPTLKQRIWAVDSKLPVRESVEMRQFIAESLARPRFFFLLLMVLGTMATVLTATGGVGVLCDTHLIAGS